MDAVTGVVTTTRAYDHERASACTLVVRVTDSAGLQSQNAVTVKIDDVNEAPVGGNDVLAVDEDATSDNLWAQLLGDDRDVDAGDVLSITSVNASGTLGSLIFDPATQTLRYVADADAFDALAPGDKLSDTFTYTLTDKAELSATTTATVTATGVDDGIVHAGGNGMDFILGTAGEDRLYGDNGDDNVPGLGGHDLIQGGRGNDVLDGGSGPDGKPVVGRLGNWSVGAQPSYRCASFRFYERRMVVCLK